ncbi:group 3 secretory phospholipase A2 [Pimephales promelas]|uniref:group 3 secretory phospholipase A2 n=1 Tax=Pimephales promelas TaxID=90988 RepID=UPI001955C74D|nr:group 3 secretory phospholipase A2 [Pimephales promelas]KAG1971287.1 group 3 secretory phospholipase A2 [Pimephales promelas]
MQSNHLFQAAVCLFMLFHGCFSADDLKRSTFCIWSRSTLAGRTQCAFLRRTPTSLLLYNSIWNQNNSLLSCITSDEQSVIESYLSRCREDSSFSESLDARFDVSELTAPGGSCEAAGITEEFTASVRRARDLMSVGADDGSVYRHTQALRRSKRAWMIPGTLWCGSGNKAAGFTDLGVFEDTDKCCREHDHCKDTIGSFSYDHGVFNTNIFTLSHCDCDNRFRRCLLGVNDTMSNLVGYGYFNVLKMSCFEFAHRMQCAKRTWWGMCVTSELAQYAVVKDAANYTDTLPEQDMKTLEMSFNQAITSGQNQVTKHIEESLIIQSKDSVSTSPWPSATTLLSRKAAASGVSTRAPTTTSPQNKPDRPHQGKLEMCDIYRDLDSCHLQIPALQEKFGLRNPDQRTLYHCNCTARLVQKILSKELDETDPVHSLLMDFVSQSCFTLPQPENCLNGKSCSTHPAEAQLIQHWRKDMAGGRHLVDFRRKLKRMNLKRSKRKDSPVRLYKKCIRMQTKLQRPRDPERKRS